MLASSFLDPVLGIDVHFEMVPTPAPVPTPIPNPFIGVVFDPLGLAAGIAIGAAIGAVMGASFQGPVLYWTAFPATNTGTEAKHVPGHILIPPGTMWAPFPKTPKPVIHPGETPKPALPVKPENDAVVITGSKTVTVMGSNAVRLGDIALSCSEPLRLPSSVVLAVPKGAPILIGGPMSLDIMAALMASLRTRFVSDSLHALLSRLKPSRFRNALHRIVCFFTGHPVDVASGKVMTEFVDIELPGPLPLKIERIYSSAFASRTGPVGHGWSFSLDQAIWRERGKVVLLAEDGREIEFDTFDFPQHRIEPGQRVYDRINRLTLHCEKDGAWRVVDHEGVVREFAPVPGRSDGRAMIMRIRSRCGFHEITFHYGVEGGKQPSAIGRLEWVRDSGGRFVHLRWDAQGRVTELHLPQPQGEGFYRHRRYEYDAAGDLVGVTDSLGHSWRFAYVTHLLTQETDRNGLSFYFAYDGLGEDAWCVRTWGDGGIYDHALSYDKHKHVTFVTNSLGFTTQYHMNLVGQVVKVVDPLGGETKYEYDPATLQRTKIVDPSGATTSYSYDTQGNRVGFMAPDGSEARYRFQARDARPVEAVDFAGFEWRWSYDSAGRVTACRLANGHEAHYEYDGAFPVRMRLPGGATVRFEHSERGELLKIVDAHGGTQLNRHDALGRLVATTLPTGATESYHYDTEGRLHATQNNVTTGRRFEHDAEGNLVRIEDAEKTVHYRYGACGRLVGHREGNVETRLTYDTELRLTAIQNALGERHELVRNPCGLVERERDFDESVTEYQYDADGKPIRVRRGSGRTTDLLYDLQGRLIEVSHGDDTFERYAYRPDGFLLAAINTEAEITFERDPMGRVLAENARLANGQETSVRSVYGGDGRRIRIETADHTQVIERDLLGNVTRIDAPEHAWQVSFARDALGLETARSFSNGASGRWQRDPVGRPVGRALSGQGFEHQQRFEWQGVSRLRRVEDSALGEVAYHYDEHGRPIAASMNGEPWCAREPEPLAVSDHDRAALAARYLPGQRPRRVEDAELEYDLDGRLVTARRNDGSETRYRWDDGGMLASVALSDDRELRLAYDALGRRIRKQLVERDPTGAWRPVDERRWVWNGSDPLTEIGHDDRSTHWVFEGERFEPLARLDREGSLSAFVDQVGAPSEWVDDRGRLVARIRVDLHGRQVSFLANGPRSPWGWPGQYHDEETGLCYNRFRYYDPRVGAYISRDPIGLFGGLYPRSYVPNPLAFADPLGLDYRPWQIHSPGYNDVVQKGLHFYGPGHIELAVRPDHKGGITFTNAIPGDASHSGLKGAIDAAKDRFANNAGFRADILAKAREGVSSLLEHAKDQSSDSLRDLARGRSREMRDIARNVERHEGGGGCSK
jgi:RHS repeat-associated protein